MNNPKSILIFGAGKIGRSFIGQLFGVAGYEVVFSDIDQNLIDLLNKHGEYRVLIKGDEEKTIKVSGVRAISGLDHGSVIREVSRSSIIAVSVGKNALKKIIPLIAEGLLLRYKEDKNKPLDIIIAENLRSAAQFFHEELIGFLPSDYSLDKLVGLVETSIGKMVPIMKQTELDLDPLAVYAESYNTLILDAKGFKGRIPQVTGLAPKENIKAWVDRKAFIHNLGHASAAYIGSLHHPRATYIYEVLEDEAIYKSVRKVMQEAATVLQRIYSDDFSATDLDTHIDNLLFRFKNRALQDTIFRVGQDRIRKLGKDDRFMGIIRLAKTQDKPYGLILEAMASAFFFRATGEQGEMSESDRLFEEYKANGVPFILQKVCGIDPKKDAGLIHEFQKCYKYLKNNYNS